MNLVPQTTDCRPPLPRSVAIWVAAWILAVGSVAEAAPRAEAWPRWEQHDAASNETVDHSIWDRLLDAYVVPSPDGIHRVRYEAFSPEDRVALDRYIDDLAGLSISNYNRSQQKAYWINLYNALTVRVVLAHYPIRSIRDVDLSPGWFTKGPWQAPLVRVEGVPLTLDDIEHRILRPIWRDPRIHYAVNCASLGCPNLMRDAFTADNSEALLDAAARAYVNHPRGLAWVDGEWVASKIYRWFAEDFGNDEAERVSHLLRYADDPLATQLRASPRIGSYRYDWRLNDARGAAAAAD